MRGSNLLFALWLLASHARHYPLPSSAKITIGPTQMTSQDPDGCDYHLTERQVRKQFDSYRVLAEGEYHDKYLQYPCVIDGTITLKGKTYRWSSNEGETMETTYPDGIPKTLGGKPSGEFANF